MSLLVTSVRRLRSDPRLHQIPPYLSLLCILGGIFWLLLLPLNQYSRQTYISENALLPGQVHTYFAGSEQNVFRAYREELRSVVNDVHVSAAGSDSHKHSGEMTGAWLEKVTTIFKSAGLPTAIQHFEYLSAGKLITGNNVYAVLHAPRGDGTEAMVVLAPQYNAKGEQNTNGVALLLTLARYFKRWSLWSKDIIFLVTPDTDSGPQAWISAYHSTHDSDMVESLPLKSGALQGAVCIDLPFDHRFHKISISYDGINGQLPNLDLVNTAVSVAGGQMGIGTSIQGMHHHDDSYRTRLMTMLRGMSNQAVGHGTGAHAVFMPYHIDAITLTASGEGWQDEMALGRTVESICRSLNNLLEHFHQSFFFYLLMQTNRFVSIGTYLPSAMAVAAGYTIMAVYLWVKAGFVETAAPVPAEPSEKAGEDSAGTALSAEEKTPPPRQKRHYQAVERQLSVPIAIILSAHLLGLIPLYLSTHIHHTLQVQTTHLTTLLSLLLPYTLSHLLSRLPPQTLPLTHTLTLLHLGLLLSTLATLNFSLSLILGLLCTPILFARRSTTPGFLSFLSRAALMVFSPMALWWMAYAAMTLVGGDLGWGDRWLEGFAFGWNVLGGWGLGVGVWLVWWPAWVVGVLVVMGGEGGKEGGRGERERGDGEGERRKREKWRK